MTRQIALSRGLVAIVDDIDYDRLISMGSWYAYASANTHYARKNIWESRDRCRTLHMHRVITGWDFATVERIDHINGDGLDNRRSNLRPATSSQNCQNARVRRDSRTGLKGVSVCRDKWKVVIKIAGVPTYLGLFPTPEAAGRAYDAAALEAFGEFARLNFPMENAS